MFSKLLFCLFYTSLDYAKYSLVEFLKWFRLTSVDDFAKEILSSEEVSGGAVPSPLLELVLALGDGHARAFGHGVQHPWVLSRQPSLLPPQRLVYRLVHV